MADEAFVFHVPQGRAGFNSYRINSQAAVSNCMSVTISTIQLPGTAISVTVKTSFADRRTALKSPSYQAFDIYRKYLGKQWKPFMLPTSIAFATAARIELLASPRNQ